MRVGRRCARRRDRGKAPHADARDGVFALGRFSEHDVCFILGEVDLGGFGCWVCHVGSGEGMAGLIVIAEAWLAMLVSSRPWNDD